MSQIIFISHGLVAFITIFCSGFTCLQMSRVVFVMDIILAVFTELCAHLTSDLMGCQFFSFYLFLAVWAFHFLMKLLLMLFHFIYVIHLSTLVASFDVSPAVGEMCGNFGLRVAFEAVIASLSRLSHFEMCILLYVGLSINHFIQIFDFTLLTLIRSVCLSHLISAKKMGSFLKILPLNRVGY